MVARKSSIATDRTDWTTIYVLTLVEFQLAIVHSLRQGSLFAYIKELDHNATTSNYSYMVSASSFMYMSWAAIAGWFSNRVSSSRPALLGAMISSLAMCVSLLMVEIVDGLVRTMFMFAVNIFIGSEVSSSILLHKPLIVAALGLMSVAKAQYVTSSTEKDRSTALALQALIVAVGLATGPLIQSAVSKLNYPGVTIPVLNIHLNLYTVPAIYIALGALTIIVLLYTKYNGEMRKVNVALSKELLEQAEASTSSKVKFDGYVVCLIFGARITFSLTLSYFVSIESSYTMLVFSWTSIEFVRTMTIITVVNGLLGCVVGALYYWNIIQKWLTPRGGMTLGLALQFCLFFFTYPFSFWPDTIETARLARCPTDMEWCASTPAINVYVYAVTEVICWGLLIPFVTLNISALLSLVLGHVKQGIWFAVYTVVGESVTIIAPPLISQLYDRTGPINVWRVILAINAVMILVWMASWRRLVPFSERVKRRFGAAVQPLDEMNGVIKLPPTE